MGNFEIGDKIIFDSVGGSYDGEVIEIGGLNTDSIKGYRIKYKIFGEERYKVVRSDSLRPAKIEKGDTVKYDIYNECEVLKVLPEQDRFCQDVLIKANLVDSQKQDFIYFLAMLDELELTEKG